MRPRRYSFFPARSQVPCSCAFSATRSKAVIAMGVPPSEDAGGLVGRVAQGLLTKVDERSDVGDLSRGQIRPAPHGVFARAPPLVVKQDDMEFGMEGAGWLLGGLHAEEISYGLVLLFGAVVLEAHHTHGRRR